MTKRVAEPVIERTVAMEAAKICRYTWPTTSMKRVTMIKPSVQALRTDKVAMSESKHFGNRQGLYAPKNERMKYHAQTPSRSSYNAQVHEHQMLSLPHQAQGFVSSLGPRSGWRDRES